MGVRLQVPSLLKQNPEIEAKNVRPFGKSTTRPIVRLDSPNLKLAQLTQSTTTPPFKRPGWSIQFRLLASLEPDSVGL